MRIIFAKFSHVTWQALIDSRFCLGPDFARAIRGHFLWSKFGDLSFFFLVFDRARDTFLCKTDLYHLKEHSKKLIRDINYKFNKKLLL